MEGPVLRSDASHDWLHASSSLLLIWRHRRRTHPARYVFHSRGWHHLSIAFLFPAFRSSANSDGDMVMNCRRAGSEDVFEIFKLYQATAQSIWEEPLLLDAKAAQEAL